MHADAELRRKKVSELEADLREADNVVSVLSTSSVCQMVGGHAEQTLLSRISICSV